MTYHGESLKVSLLRNKLRSVIDIIVVALTMNAAFFFKNKLSLSTKILSTAMTANKARVKDIRWIKEPLEPSQKWRSTSNMRRPRPFSEMNFNAWIILWCLVYSSS